MGGEAFGVAGVAAVAVFPAGFEGFPQIDDFCAEGFGGGAEFVECGDGFEDGVRLGIEGLEECAEGFDRAGFGGIDVGLGEGSGCGNLDGRAGIFEEGRQLVGVGGDGAWSSHAKADRAPVTDGGDG